MMPHVLVHTFRPPRAPAPDMRCVVHGSAASFLDRALPWLLAREAENNLILGIALARAGGDPEGEPPPWFASLEDRGSLLGAAFRTPPHMLGLTEIPEDAVPLLARMVADAFSELPGVVGPEDAARVFADIWCAGHPVRPRVEMRMGIYELRELVSPGPMPPGAARLPRDDERDLLVRWMEGFEEDTGIFSTGAAGTLDQLLAADAVRVWEAGGELVAMAGISGTTPGGARIGYVYTPLALRGRGYGSAVTAALTRELLDEGHAFCVLYANLADPVATGIYRRMGYRQVSSATSIRFDPEPT